MGVFYVTAYLLACALVASLGREKVLGFWGYFLLALLLTPLPILILLLLTLPRRKAAPE